MAQVPLQTAVQGELQHDISEQKLTSLKEVLQLHRHTLQQNTLLDVAIDKIITDDNRDILQPARDQNTVQKNALDTRITELDTKIKFLEGQKAVAQKTLKTPAFSNVDVDINYEQLRLAVPALSGLSGATAFTEGLDKLRRYAEAEKFTEANYLTALSSLLTGDAHDYYVGIDNLPVENVIRLLQARYGTFRYIGSQLTKLNNITRKADQNIHAFVAQVEGLINATKSLWAQDQRAGVRAQVLNTAVMANISPATSKLVKAMQYKAHTQGLMPTWDSIINCIHDAELIEPYVPATESNTVMVNASELQRRDHSDHRRNSRDRQIALRRNMSPDTFTPRQPSASPPPTSKSLHISPKRLTRERSFERKPRVFSSRRTTPSPSRSQTNPKSLTYQSQGQLMPYVQSQTRNQTDRPVVESLNPLASSFIPHAAYAQTNRPAPPIPPPQYNNFYAQPQYSRNRPTYRYDRRPTPHRQNAYRSLSPGRPSYPLQSNYYNRDNSRVFTRQRTPSSSRQWNYNSRENKNYTRMYGKMQHSFSLQCQNPDCQNLKHPFYACPYFISMVRANSASVQDKQAPQSQSRQAAKKSNRKKY